MKNKTNLCSIRKNFIFHSATSLDGFDWFSILEFNQHSRRIGNKQPTSCIVLSPSQKNSDSKNRTRLGEQQLRFRKKDSTFFSNLMTVVSQRNILSFPWLERFAHQYRIEATHRQHLWIFTLRLNIHTTDNVLFLLDGGSIQTPRASANSGYSAPKPPREYLADLHTYAGWTYLRCNWHFSKSNLQRTKIQEIVSFRSADYSSKWKIVWKNLYIIYI